MGVYRRGHVWYYRLQSQGKVYREAAGPTKQHAVELLAQRRCELADARRLRQPFEIHAPTIGSVLDAYLASRRALGRRSIVRMDGSCAHLVAVFGRGATVDTITTEAIERYAARRRDEEGAAPGTVNRELAALRAAMRLAHEAGRIGSVPRVRMLREPPGRVRYLSAEEEARLVATCRPGLARFVVVAIATGCRLSEMLALRWRDVDTAGRVLHVEHTKTGKRRDVPISDACAAALGDAGDDDAPVFTRRDGQPLQASNAIQQFRRACVRARLPGVSIHTLRHTAASRVAQRTGNLAAVQALLGHGSLHMALRYSHLAAAHLREAVEAIHPGQAQKQAQGES